MPITKRYAKKTVKLQPNRIEAFLEFDDIISINSDIRAKVDEITYSLDEVTKARSIFEWVRDEVSHSKDSGEEAVTCSAIEVFSRRTGICYPKAHLLASMMRHAEIPCGFCYQVFDNNLAQTEKRNALHGLNAFYLKTTNRWHRVDPRGNRNDVQAEFSTGDEMLAFPEMNFCDDVVYAAPFDVVVAALQNAENIMALWPHLPSIPKVG